MADETKKEEGAGETKEDVVTKADLDAASSRAEKAEKELEDMRLEVMSPDYIDFLDNKEKPAKKEEGKEDKPLTDEQLDKMSKKEILEHAKNMVSEVEKKVDSRFTDSVKEAKQKAVADFAETVEDFEQYRPVMHGLSTDPKNYGKSLPQLYKMAKEHVSGIHAKVSEAEKEKQKHSSGEKPGGGAEAWEKQRKMTGAEAANEAAQEVADALGPLPEK